MAARGRGTALQHAVTPTPAVSRDSTGGRPYAGPVRHGRACPSPHLRDAGVRHDAGPGGDAAPTRAQEREHDAAVCEGGDLAAPRGHHGGVGVTARSPDTLRLTTKRWHGSGKSPLGNFPSRDVESLRIARRRWCLWLCGAQHVVLGRTAHPLPESGDSRTLSPSGYVFAASR